MKTRAILLGSLAVALALALTWIVTANALQPSSSSPMAAQTADGPQRGSEVRAMHNPQSGKARAARCPGLYQVLDNSEWPGGTGMSGGVSMP